MAQFHLRFMVAPLPMVYIFRILFVLQDCVLMLMTSKQKSILTAKLLKLGHRCYKIKKKQKHFLHSTTDTQSKLLKQYWFKKTLLTYI